MTPFVNTVVVGGGQAGLAVSHYLTDYAINHVVLEQADRPADAWRNRRWDSFTLNTPRWQSRVPGVRYGDDNPDGFMPKHEVVAHLDELARRLPVRTRARVTNIRRYGGNGCYVIKTSKGETISARNVVVATGLYQSPMIPALAQDLSVSHQAAPLRHVSQPGPAFAGSRVGCRQRAIRRADRRRALRVRAKGLSRDRPRRENAAALPRQGRKLVVRQDGSI
jgi:cation diffusion facilitator CzcD-associated flavoprotein CzcO